MDNTPKSTPEYIDYDDYGSYPEIDSSEGAHISNIDNKTDETENIQSEPSIDSDASQEINGPTEPKMLEALTDKTDKVLGETYSKLTALSKFKDMLFSPDGKYNEQRKSIHETVKAISTRHFGTVEYHKEIEKYDDSPDDTAETSLQKKAYRKAILVFAQKLGFLGDKPLLPTNDFETKMNLSSNPEKHDGEVEAIIIPGSAALSNYKRFYHASKAISTGAINTNKIVFAACGRKTTEGEKKTMRDAGYDEGETEFDLGLQAVRDIAGEFVHGPVESVRTVNLNGSEYPVRVLSGLVMIDDKVISIDIVNSPYDKTRRDEKGNLANRANTEETFFSVMTALDNHTPEKTVCIASHDVWKPCQHVAAEYIFSGYFGKNVISSGPDNCDRLRVNENGELDIRMAEAVVDEMSKYLDELEKLDVFLAEQNILRLFSKTMSGNKFDDKVLFTNKIVRGLAGKLK